MTPPAPNAESRPAYASTIRRINRTTLDRPRLGLRLAAGAGFVLGSRLGEAWTPTDDEIRERLGITAAGAVGRLQRRIASCELRNRALMYLTKRQGIDPVLPLLRVRDTGNIGRLRADGNPLVVVFWHQGVVRSIGAAVAQLGHPVLHAVLRAPSHPHTLFRWREVADPAAGTRFLLDAMKEIRRGGIPVLSLDGIPSANAPWFEYLGRPLRLPLGAAIIANRSRARLVPATSRWVGGSSAIEVTLHEPLPEPNAAPRDREAWQSELLGQAIGFYERHARAHPGDLRPLDFRTGHARDGAAPASPGRRRDAEPDSPPVPAV